MTDFDAPRSYLLVAARDPLTAAAAVWAWPESPPDLSIVSPSDRARDTALVASGGHYVEIIDEPMLGRRASFESPDDFAARFAHAVRIVLAYDARAALVVVDDAPRSWQLPLYLDNVALLRHAESIEHALPLPLSDVVEADRAHPRS